MKHRLLVMGGLALLAAAGCVTLTQTPLGSGMSLLPEGNGIQRLAFPVGDRTQRVIWSPPHVALIGERTGLGAIGQEVTWLDASFKRLVHACWSSDGRRIALVVQTGPTSEGSASTAENVTTITLNDPGTRTFTPLASNLQDGSASMSPDGKHLLVSDSTSLGVYRYTLYDLENNTSRPLALGDETRTTSAEVLWSADGKKVARLMPKHRLYLADLVKGETRHVASEASGMAGWSADGTTFYTYDVGNGTRLFSQPSDGGSGSTLTLRLPEGAQGNPTDLRLSPDGQTVAFTLMSLRAQGVFVSDLTGGVARQVVPPSRFVGWLPDGKSLICRVDTDDQEVSYTVTLSER